MFPKNNPSTSSSGEQGVDSPFSRNSKLIRSPTLKNIPQQNEKTISQVKEKVVNDNAAIIEKLNMFERLCETLQKQVNDLKTENQRLRESITNNVINPMEIATVGEFQTDEEELAQETEWILHKNKKKNVTKKRKAESPPDIEKFTKSSKSASVQETVVVMKTKDKPLSKTPKLPPVILSNISDFNKVQDVMASQNIKYEIKLLNNKQLSIKVFSENDYRSLTRAINEAKFEWHSYENKATRPCKVIARGLHPTCNTNFILDDLKQLGFNVLSVVNLTKKKKLNDKEIIDPLPLFMLTFDHSEDIKKVFSITHIVKTKVRIEAIRKQKEQIPQCKRCQRFEHTQSFCNREPRCVKCAGSHLTINCNLDKKAPPKCSNCHEAHPANYRGCMVAKELQKRRLAKNKVSKKKTVETLNPNQQKLPTPKIIKGVSYSDVAKKLVTPNRNKTTSKGQQSPKNKLSKEELFMSSMEKMFSKIDEISVRLEKIENSYAIRHIGTPRSILK